MGRRAAQRPVNRLTVSVRLTRREILYRDTYGTSMCARVTHAIVLKRRNVRRDARRGRAWRGDARTHARVRECVRACVGACNARERCARRLFRYCCYCWGNNRPSIGCPGTMYLFRCGQGCSIDRPPFAKKHRERIVLNSPVQWWIRVYSESFLRPIFSPTILTRRFVARFSSIRGVKGGGESRRIEDRYCYYYYYWLRY